MIRDGVWYLLRIIWIIDHFILTPSRSLSLSVPVECFRALYAFLLLATHALTFFSLQ
jgi:hypothetical protein